MQNAPREKKGCFVGLSQTVEDDFKLSGERVVLADLKGKDKLQTARMFPERSLQDFCAAAGAFELHRTRERSSGGYQVYT